MGAFRLVTSVLAVAGFALAQAPAAPPAVPQPDGRVSNSHIHLLSKDLDAQRHFWVDIIGATPGKDGAYHNFYTLPKVLVTVEKCNPAGGTEGSIVNHIGFRVRDMKDILAKVAAQGYTIQVVNPNKDNPTQAFFLGPDNLRVELLAGPNLTTVSENHQVHFFTPDPGAMQGWYVSNFGAVPQDFGKAKLANLPGVTLIFSPVDAPVAGTQGRTLDHIGFEVKDLEGFCKTLEASGVSLLTPYRKNPLGYAEASLTDPWGTLIELDEGFAASLRSQGLVRP